jgi:RNA polymerase sigma factor (sigma-70 family)
VRQGNSDAFAAIVEHYQSPIIRYLYRMTGNYEVAEDLAQDTFVKAYKGILRTDSELAFKAWLYRIATNNALQYHRRKKLLSFIPLSSLSANNPALKAPPGNNEDRLLIKQVLSRVSPDQGYAWCCIS